VGGDALHILLFEVRSRSGQGFSAGWGNSHSGVQPFTWGECYCRGVTWEGGATPRTAWTLAAVFSSKTIVAEEESTGRAVSFDKDPSHNAYCLPSLMFREWGGKGGNFLVFLLLLNTYHSLNRDSRGGLYFRVRGEIL